MATKNTALVQKLIWPVVVLIVAFGAFYLKPWQQKPTETISVSATGTAKAAPDVAKITATVESKNPNIDQARKETEEKTTKIIATIKQLGIEEADVKTQNISAGQSYEIQLYPPKPNTNQYSVSLEITVRDFKIADSVISTLTQNGATNLYGPNLTFDDKTLEKAKSQARENAVTSAKAKAQELAKATGRGVGKVVNIKEQGDYNVPGPLYAVGGRDLQEKANTIQPGQDQVTINLSVDFQLK